MVSIFDFRHDNMHDDLVVGITNFNCQFFVMNISGTSDVGVQNNISGNTSLLQNLINFQLLLIRRNLN